MREPIENEYFNWLCAKVLEGNGRNYISLLSMLHKTEFIWVVPSDRNRAADGVELRDDFFTEARPEIDNAFQELPCSVLEVLISFAKRAQFQTDIPVRDWFWEFLENLGLQEYRRVYPVNRPVIEDIIRTFIWRTYSPNGDGGLFPLSQTQNDQRKVEVWYQFCEYLEDRGLF